MRLVPSKMGLYVLAADSLACKRDGRNEERRKWENQKKRDPKQGKAKQSRTKQNTVRTIDQSLALTFRIPCGFPISIRKRFKNQKGKRTRCKHQTLSPSLSLSSSALLSSMVLTCSGLFSCRFRHNGAIYIYMMWKIIRRKVMIKTKLRRWI